MIFGFWVQKLYQDDAQAEFSPIDYAVSWGLFAEPEIARHITVNQYDRYLNWKIDRLPVPAEQAMQMVSNMHIIPANPKIAKDIQKVKRGDLVRLKGELVEVKDHGLGLDVLGIHLPIRGMVLVKYFVLVQFSGLKKSKAECDV